MKDRTRSDDATGWYALYMSITQNLTPSRALAAMEGRATGGKRLTWEQFLAAYRSGEAMLKEARQARNRSEKMRGYQREYRRTHPLTEAQRIRRREYLREYRAARRSLRPSS